MIKIVIGAFICTLLGIVAFMVIDPNIGISDSNVTQVVEVDESKIFSVAIEGEVEKSGTYALKEEAKMSDLIDAAGGLTSSADSRAFNLNVALTKGQTYYIASRYDTSNVCSLNELNKVNINEGTADDLMRVSGFTTSVANSVISYRDEHGSYQTIEDLLNVYGIGNATYRKVRNYVILHA